MCGLSLNAGKFGLTTNTSIPACMHKNKRKKTITFIPNVLCGSNIHYLEALNNSRLSKWFDSRASKMQMNNGGRKSSLQKFYHCIKLKNQSLTLNLL